MVKNFPHTGIQKQIPKSQFFKSKFPKCTYSATILWDDSLYINAQRRFQNFHPLKAKVLWFLRLKSEYKGYIASKIQLKPSIAFPFPPDSDGPGIYQRGQCQPMFAICQKIC